MSRLPALVTAALMGALLTRCVGVAQSGVSVPRSSDGVQTVSDAADSLVHRSSASENARAAIGVTDAFGSVVRDISGNERFLARFTGATRTDFTRTASGSTSPPSKRIVAVTSLVMRPSFGNVSAYCQSSAGFSAKGIPSLDETFGWQSGVFSGGTRMTDGFRFSTWSANASGKAVQAPIGALSIVRSGDATCPMMAPAYSLNGAEAINTFSIPLTATYRFGSLWDVSISNATFSDGEVLGVATTQGRQPQIAGVITKGNLELAAFRTNARGNGTLTITSTGAQYVLADWIVAGT